MTGISHTFQGGTQHTRDTRTLGVDLFISPIVIFIDIVIYWLIHAVCSFVDSCDSHNNFTTASSNQVSNNYIKPFLRNPKPFCSVIYSPCMGVVLTRITLPFFSSRLVSKLIHTSSIDSERPPTSPTCETFSCPAQPHKGFRGCSNN